MLAQRRSAHLAPGSAFLAGLLLVLVVLSGVLAYQAADAARSEARSTERALRGFSSFAAWELARAADEGMRRGLHDSGRRAFAAPVSADAAGVEALARAATAALAWCGCANPSAGAFILRQRGDTVRLLTAGTTPGVRRWLGSPAAAVLAAPHPAAADAQPRLTPLQAEGSDLVAVTVREDVPGGQVVRGFLASPLQLAAAVLDAAYYGPAPVLGGEVLEPRVAAISAVTSTRDGTLLWRSLRERAPAPRDGWVDAKVGAWPPEPLARGTVTRRLDGVLGGLTARVAVQALPGVAAPPAAPGSRLPLLLTVFGLTLALVSVAIVQLRRQQELVRLRDDFVSGVSHELRTPLAQIRLFADLLESGRLATGEQQSRSVRIINEESRRLSWLVENILHFSRAQRGAGRVAPVPLHAGPLLREIVDAFAPLARDRATRFVVEADDEVVVRADSDALRQVLLNLLDNAVKYGPEGQWVRVRAELRGVALRIWVDDQGPGIPPEERARVWEPYRRLSRDADGAGGGSGIGLAVVKDLVELHGGRVGVAEAPGGGARIWVELPYAMHAGPAPAAASAAEPARAAGGGR